MTQLLRKPARSLERGFVIVAVLWILVALSALATIFSVYLSKSARVLGANDIGIQAEALASRLATDPPALAALRGKLERNRLTTPLFDSARFTRHLEAAYGRMWAMWQAGEGVRGFAVDAIE